MADLAAAREAYLEGRDAPDGVRPVVLDAWRRSREHGVDPGRLRQQDVDPEELRRAREEHHELLAAAEPFLELVHHTLSDEPHIVALSDPEGFILRLLTGPGLDPRRLEPSNLVEGASWHERDIGGNGVGTCLATGEPVILIGPEHFQEAYLGWTCIGAPIRDSEGRAAGALDISVPNERAHVHTWGWALSLARGVEASLVRGSAAGVAELSRTEYDAEEPLHSVEAVFELLAGHLDISPTHARFLDEARAELVKAETRREASIRRLRATIAERTRAERILERERQLLERLIDSIPVMVTIYDPAIQEVRLNRHVEEVVGWTNEDLEHGDVMELCYPDPELRERVRRFMQSVEPGWRDFEMRAKDGSVVPASWANIRLTDDRQVGIGIDLSERVEAERELQHAYDKAKDALRERDKVLAIVSHDLRNPLNTLTMASSLLLEDLPREKKEAQVAVIRRAVDQMKRLIDDLLDAARIEGGGLRIVPEPRGADELVRVAVEALSPLAQARSITLEAEAETAAPVHVDGDRILQVFTNLISNAIRHTPEDGRIVVRAEGGGGADGDVDGGAVVRFSVRDTGRGIAPEDLPRVFDRYWQGESSGEAGAGLGLAIAKGVVEAHGGRIGAESEPARGSTFSFTLPVRTADGGG